MGKKLGMHYLLVMLRRFFVFQFFLLFFLNVPEQLLASQIFVYEGQNATSETRKMTVTTQGTLCLLYKGLSDDPPIFRLFSSNVQNHLSLKPGPLLNLKPSYHARRMGKWIFIVEGQDFLQEKVKYSIHTEGDYQMVFRGFSQGENKASYTLNRQNHQVFIHLGQNLKASEVQYTITEGLDRDYLQNGYQTHASAVLYTLEKGISQYFLYSGILQKPENMVLQLNPFRLDAAHGLALIFSPVGTYFSQARDLPFILSLKNLWEIRRETLLVIYLMEKQVDPDC